jgi:glycosyltransferase involved in cell wall biosynthesis
MEVSFIIPAYNEEKLLPFCLKAIGEAVRSYRGDLAYEVIVVDDHSTDGTAGVARALGAVVVPCDAQGVTQARQTGMVAARYPVHAYIDADNRVPLHWLRNLERLDEYVAVSGPVWFDQQGVVARAAASTFTWFQRAAHRVVGATLQGGNYAVRRDALVAAGGHSVNIEFYGEDTDLARRLSQVGEVGFLPEMWCNTSARRFSQQGYLMTAALYTANYLSIHAGYGPVTKTHKNFR